MSHLGVMKVYIEVKFIYLLIGVMLVQKLYAKVILERFKMDSYNTHGRRTTITFLTWDKVDKSKLLPMFNW